MKTNIVLEFDVPDPAAIVDVMKKLDPPSLPHFAGSARVVVEPHASRMIEWLDADDATPADSRFVELPTGQLFTVAANVTVAGSFELWVGPPEVVGVSIVDDEARPAILMTFHGSEVDGKSDDDMTVVIPLEAGTALAAFLEGEIQKWAHWREEHQGGK